MNAHQSYNQLQYLGDLMLVSFGYLLSYVFMFSFPDPVPDSRSISIEQEFKDWELGQQLHDEVNGIVDWANRSSDTAYDYKLIEQTKSNLASCRRNNDWTRMYRELRQQASRNVCRILSPSLHRRSCIQTKRLIHDYVREVRRCVSFELRPGGIGNRTYASYTQERKRLLDDLSRLTGRTTLVLQGGAMLSLCHIGVARALLRRNLLPRVITGNGTGALIASMIGCSPERELAQRLDGASIKLSAFKRAKDRRPGGMAGTWRILDHWNTLMRRLRRFRLTGHFFDIHVLADCVGENVGDLTFEEAYERSGRVLNITIAIPSGGGVPRLLNCHTAPHVLVRTAVTASMASSKRMYAPVHLLQKDDTGAITQYVAADTPGVSDHLQHHYEADFSPLERAGQMDNVNHYIISQTRPYIIPFLQLQARLDRWPICGSLFRILCSEAIHVMETMKYLGVLPTFIERILIDEVVPSSANWPSLVLTPSLSIRDYFTVFDLPTTEQIEYMADKGERSIWPWLCQLKIRCSVEFEIDAGRQSLHKISDQINATN